VETLNFEVTPFLVNCYVLKDGGEAIVVDPGEGTPRLLSCLKDVRVRTVVNTHGHGDHCGGNAAVVAATGAELTCHEADLPLLRSIEAQGQMFGVHFPPSPDPDRFLGDGDVLRVGASTLQVRHTPGHSPGHIVLMGEGFVFCGDVLFRGAIGRTDLPGGDYDQLLESIRTVLLPLPDETTVYCGHGPSTTIGDERRTNPFLQRLSAASLPPQ
jgi:hydroxyacylglutathione hydrolase